MGMQIAALNDAGTDEVACETAVESSKQVLDDFRAEMKKWSNAKKNDGKK